MALARRALLLAFVAVCALLLSVGVVGPGEPPRDHATTDAVVVAATTGAPAATTALITSVSKQTSPLVLLATSGTAAARRTRHRVRPLGRRGGARRPGRRGRHRRLRPDPIPGVDEQLARMAIELNVLVGSFRY